MSLSDISNDFKILKEMPDLRKGSWTSKMLDGTHGKLLEEESAVNNDLFQDLDFGKAFVNPFGEKIKQGCHKPGGANREGIENYIPGAEDSPPNSTVA